MNVLGLDVGFSATRETSAFCLLGVNSERQEIEFVEGPRRFALGDASTIFRRLSGSYPSIKWVSVDAPLTPARLEDRPKSGRGVDKRFSKGAFHSSKGGPQPGSISVPLQGWPLYEAGMTMLEHFRESQLGDYVPFEQFKRAPAGGVVECIPKLTQALLVPRTAVRERRGTVDDHLFPLIFAKEGPHRRALDRALCGYGFSGRVEDLISEISLAPRRHHEELAALVAAIQGVLVATGRATVVGCVGDYEGYYALPHRGAWHPDWAQAFGSTRADGVEVVDIGPATPPGASEERSSPPKPADDSYRRLLERLEAFVEERDWEQFHSPKNLVMALSVEVAELVEHFQWLTEEQSYNLPPGKLRQIEEEIGDVTIYLAELAEKLGIDPIEAAKAKVKINEKKYPAALVRGRPNKYTEYPK